MWHKLPFNCNCNNIYCTCVYGKSFHVWLEHFRPQVWHCRLGLSESECSHICSSKDSFTEQPQPEWKMHPQPELLSAQTAWQSSCSRAQRHRLNAVRARPYEGVMSNKPVIEKSNRPPFPEISVEWVCASACFIHGLDDHIIVEESKTS